LESQSDGRDNVDESSASFFDMFKKLSKETNRKNTSFLSKKKLNVKAFIN
jgi:hypothetical protein